MTIQNIEYLDGPHCPFVLECHEDESKVLDILCLGQKLVVFSVHDNCGIHQRDSTTEQD